MTEQPIDPDGDDDAERDAQEPNDGPLTAEKAEALIPKRAG